ncbi:TetR/AcrR family transcriptional regulator [Halorarius halobius]|uniref:TetR/AcrR family transcriptional regulator n=1 Tax=Halorarius halobius TaxID=2962671 RepID=UPI0020CBE227|nr:TetR/AcrR family transcriptional regulator [Halorarius halobius]
MGDTSEDIMAATYCALCEHGYADLTMQRIADESGKSKAALHYHYDTKEELLNAFLEHLLDQFESRLACEAADPDERLATFLDAVFEPATDDSGEFPVALLEIKAQAPYHDAYRERLTAMDDRMRAIVADAVADGVERGEFDDCDPDEVARFVVTLINGAHAREVALGEPPAESRRRVEAYLDRTLGRREVSA